MVAGYSVPAVGFECSAMPDEQQEEPPARWAWGRWIAWVLFLLFIAYPLSVGPVYWLASRLGVLAQWNYSLGIFYYPLWCLADAYEPAGSLFDWYFGLWGFHKTGP